MPPYGKHPDLLVRQESPLNGGPPPELMRRDFFTPNSLFFVRNHGNVPELDPSSFRLVVDGLVKRPLELSLEELRDRFPRREREAVLQCAGNRRLEMMATEPIPGELGWGSEAVSNAAWAGVALADVLAAAEPEPRAQYAAFTGLDETERHGHRMHFGGSVPIAKALAPEVLLADTMNGEPLPLPHGAPLRALVPGYIGARSVKWLSRITLQAAPSDNYFQSHAYRLFPPQVRASNVVWEEGLMLGEQSVNCVICAPAPDDTVGTGAVAVNGIALAGGGRAIVRVDLSSDAGRNWVSADLGADHGPWAWRFWEGRVEVGPGRREIVARAWDSAANTQPEDVAKLWNFKGYMNNAWARVRVLGG